MLDNIVYIENLLQRAQHGMNAVFRFCNKFLMQKQVLAYMFDIHLIWDIIGSCNFNCDYCLSHSNDTSEKPYPINAVKANEVLDASGKTYDINLVGGEPTLLPNFIEFCQQTDGSFFNYVDKDHKFTDQNKETNLDDANGRAIWALGYLISLNGLLPVEIIAQAKIIIEKSLKRFHTVHSTRAMAFAIKGIYYYYSTVKSSENFYLLKTFADRLVQMYKHESNEKWEWYEAYLTYANSVLPEAMLYAWLLTDKPVYKDIAISSLNFLLAQIFNENGIEVISNKHWLQKGETAGHFGEQPIDVAYTIMTLNKFRYIFMEEEYKKKMEIAFNWFLGNNRLHHIVYNPCTGGCYDGLEEKHVNLNQGAESTISYLMARLTMEKYHSE